MKERKSNFIKCSPDSNQKRKLLFECIKKGDTWLLITDDEKNEPSYFLKYRISEEKVIIWNKKNEIIFNDKFEKIDSRFLSYRIKKYHY